MYIKPFAVEEWMNEWEVGARYNIAETCVDSVSLNELFALTGEDKAAFLENLAARRLTYGDIEGAPAFRQGICSLYKTVKPENIVTTHGAAGANHHVFCSLVSPGDLVISVLPTYQQLYSIPESLGAKVKILPLSRENGYLPDLDALRALAVPGTKMTVICDDNMMIEGIFTDGDLRRVFDMGVDVRQLSIADVMTPGGIRVRPGILAVEALNLMQSRHITSVMVADGDHLLGVLHMHDLLRAGVV